MRDKFKGLDGSAVAYDLDAVIDVVKGHSQIKRGWLSLIVYDGSSRSFVELRSAPPDYKGNAADEAEQVTEQYVCDNFQLEPAQLRVLRTDPGKWKLLDRRG